MIKKGDKVICVNDEAISFLKSYLTKNNQYEIFEYHLDIGDGYVNIINDANQRCSYRLDRFISIADFREKQIKSVLDD